MTRPDERIPIALLTGYLGSGKTTLVNALVRRREWSDTALIVNEIGEIGLDHLLVEQSDGNILLLDSGCLCCAMQGGLRETLADLFVRRVKGTIPPFRRVVIETTGLADPGPIANSLAADSLSREEFRLAAIVTTVDALRGERTLDAEWEAVRQVALADVLVLTKTDLVEPNAAASLHAKVATLNPLAPRVEAVMGALAPEHIFPADPVRLAKDVAAPSRLSTGGRYRAADAHLRGVRTASFVLPSATTWTGWAAWSGLAAAHFGDRLLRTKGIVEIDGRPVVVHGVGSYFHPPRVLDRWPSDDRRSRLVCVSRDVDPHELAASLRAFTLPQGAERPQSFRELEDMDIR